MSPAKGKIQGCTRSLVWTFAALLTASPAAWADVTVSLTAPANGTSYVPPVNITLSASASAGQGYTLSKVEFFSGTTLIGTDTSSPYSIAWTNAPSGQHVLTAKATAIKKNSPDQTATSTAVNVTVNAPPVVTITSPVSDATYTIPPPPITVTAVASDSDGTIAKVDFYENCSFSPDKLLATVTSPPYTFVWALPPPYYYEDKFSQDYGIQAFATDNLGTLVGSECVFGIATVPSVALTSPTNGASFSAPATINLTATVSPADGPIDKVQFFNGTTLLGESLSAPHAFSWQNVPAGTYSLSARVLYHLETEVQASPAVNITVSAVQQQLHFIHVDHLNTPRLVANQQGQVVWRWDQQEPFGVNVADENPSGLGVFEFSMRFPGQYFDKETNLHYNYFRDYDPSIGRYVESDPIGLRGGLNTYAYVAGDPLKRIDPTGRQQSGQSEVGIGPMPGDDGADQSSPLSSPVSPPVVGTSPAYVSCYVNCLQEEALNLGGKTLLACGGIGGAIGIRLGLKAGAIAACGCVVITVLPVGSVVDARCRRKAENCL